MSYYSPYPENEWIEGLTGDQCLYHLKRMKRTARKHGVKLGKISCNLNHSREYSSWFDITQAFAEEVIHAHSRQKPSQRRNCLIQPRFRIKLNTDWRWSISLWPCLEYDHTQHSDSCSCKGGSLDCLGFGDEEE